MSEKDQKIESSDEQVGSILRRLSLRWKLLQGIGAALIGLSLMIEGPLPPDPAFPTTESFPLILGIIVLDAGLLASGSKWFAQNRSGST